MIDSRKIHAHAEMAIGKSEPNGASAFVVPSGRAPKKFNFWRGIYNKDKNYILGRTPKNWGKPYDSFPPFPPFGIIVEWTLGKFRWNE